MNDDSDTTRFRVPRLAALGLLLLALHGLTWAFGLGDWVGVLSGTPVPGVDWPVAALGAAAHVVTWFGAVVVAPILLIATCLLEVVSPAGAPWPGSQRR